MYIHVEQGLSSFLTTQFNTNNNEINNFLTSLRNKLIQDNNTFDLSNQLILTENDLKGILFHQIKTEFSNDPNNPNYLDYSVHSEDSDLIAITDDYCTGLTEGGDISHEETKTRQTDLCITLNPTYDEEEQITKGYRRGGDHIDIELKYIRKGFSRKYRGDIQRDLCKLKYLVDTAEGRNLNPNHGINHYGIFFLGFKKRSILEQYLREDDFSLYQKIVSFQNIQNVSILLFYKEEI